MRRPVTIAGVAAACLLVLAGPVHAASSGSRAGENKTIRLSNERTLTRVAMAEQLVKVRSRPDLKARGGPGLRFTTEHGAPEPYIALTETEGTDGHRWVRIRVARRPNGQTGWVRREALGPYRRVVTKLLVNRRTLRVTLYRSGKRVMRFPIGVGARSTPTPAGRFWIREKLRYKRDPLYGDRALGTSAYAPNLEDWPLGGVIGMHGTGEPWLIPGRPSHGCIRIRNQDIRRLYRAVPVGTPLRIV